MAQSLSFLRSHPAKVPAVAAVAILIFGIRRAKVSKPSDVAAKSSTGSSREKKVGVDARFLAQMKKLLPICVPGIFSREAGLDIWFSGFNGSVVKSIVSRDKKKMIEFALMMWPLSAVNNSLKLCISSLALSFRTRLTRYAHDQYLNGITFYKITNIDNRIQNADQLLTQDIDKFADSLSHLYSDIAKPLVDIFLFAYKLGQAIGRDAPAAMISYFFFSGVLLRSLSPPFGKYTAQEQKLEGDFRYCHSRIITHSEEIAFYGGAEREKSIVNSAFTKIQKHIQTVILLRFGNGIVDSVFVKYLATTLAYYLLARPVLYPTYATKFMGDTAADPTKIMEDYSRNIGRIILAGRDLTRFAGYTSRVSELFNVLDDITKGKYQRTMVSKKADEKAELKSIDTGALKGKVQVQDGVIEFQKVPIVTPNGDVLVKQLEFRVERGMNCLITGPNGCGKSSLFRILGDLWPLFSGTLTKPTPNNLFYVPQKPYLALGTLRDQVIYPHTKEQALARGYDDKKIGELLETVYLGYLVEREGGFDSVSDWADVLSGGEKQRVAMARLFYHKPQFAILDECTSAVSVDVEGLMYTHARKVGITLFTVSHRTSLFKYHEYLLRFDGEGGYEFTRFDGDESAFQFSHGKTKPSQQFDEE
ncbi:ABC transporter transmembrane region 2-domain-containing protein [Paraphysoderma sedebokerense]|nr:ABC transporter transmembrane region 2-domain-containing protein [Paraphysoderma sedebokerense]